MERVEKSAPIQGKLYSRCEAVGSDAPARLHSVIQLLVRHAPQVGAIFQRLPDDRALDLGIVRQLALDHRDVAQWAESNDVGIARTGQPDFAHGHNQWAGLWPDIGDGNECRRPRQQVLQLAFIREARRLDRGPLLSRLLANEYFHPSAFIRPIDPTPLGPAASSDNPRT